MKLIACLGNPEPRFDNTRHNAGFAFGDYLINRLSLPQPSLENKFQAKISKKDFIVCFPQTYMNNSGLAVKAIMDFYKISPEDFLLVFDDLDLTLGTYKLTDKHPHTHNGLKSVVQNLSTDKFKLLRLGIDGRAGDRSVSSLDYVLGKFTPEQQEKLTAVFPSAVSDVVSWLR